MTFLHKDHLGSVRAISGPDGTPEERTLYRPYGAQSEVVTATLSDDRSWLGERYDAGAGLQYLNARYYDPELAMFLQPDWFDPTDPMVGTSRYAYGLGNPIGYRDPTGNRNDNEGDHGNVDETGGSGTGSGDSPVGGEHVSGGSDDDSIGDDGEEKEQDTRKSFPLASGRAMPSYIDIDIALLITGIGPAVRAVGAAATTASTTATTAVAEKAAMRAAASAPYKSTGLTVAGRALTKHPGAVGFSNGVALSKNLRSTQAINDAAEQVVSKLLETGTRATRETGRFGSVIEYMTPSGAGVRFDAITKEFIGFLGGR